MSVIPTRPALTRWRMAPTTRATVRPIACFLSEALLETRRECGFATNSRGPDEDVNVYLAHLLLAHLDGAPPGDVLPGAEPLLLPPERGRRGLAEWYRRNGDERLLALGLYRRGDLQRRRAVPFGFTAARAAARDLADGRSCYATAAALLRDGAPGARGLAPVLRKLSLAFADYVAVLEALARGRLGLGERLSQAALSELAAPPGPGDPVALDAFLDRLLDHQRAPDTRTRAALARAAEQAGVDASAVLTEDGA